MEIPTLINSGSKINGELMFNSDVRIDGEVLGKVESDKSAIIGAEGYVKGFLRARDLVVFGRLEGNIVVSGITVLHSGSSIFGNLYTRVIEVKEGANITARVITYDKLETFDEAQIHLAEEMIKIQPGRRNVPHFSNAHITFDDNLDILKENSEIVSLPNEEAKNLQTPSDLGKLLSTVAEHATVTPETENIQQVQIPELFITDHRIEHLSGKKNNENTDSSDQSDNLEEFSSNSISKVFSIASCLGEPTKVDPFSIRVGKKKIYKPDVNLTFPSIRKGKERTILGFEELKNLLIRAKYPEINLLEKKIGPEKKAFTINDAISQLPIDDYSSLFK